MLARTSTGDGGTSENWIKEDLADLLCRHDYDLAQVGELLADLENLTTGDRVFEEISTPEGVRKVEGRELSASPRLLGLYVCKVGETRGVTPEGIWDWGRMQAEALGLFGGIGRSLPLLDTLVVDENTAALEYARIMLRKLGCRARSARSGGEAVAMAKGVAFDLVIIDNAVSGLGVQDLKELLSRRLREAWGQEPIFAIMRENSRESTKGEWDAFLAKPLAMGELKHLTHAARQRKKTRGNKGEYLLELPVLDLSSWQDEGPLLNRLARTLVAQGREFLARAMSEDFGLIASEFELEVRSLKNGADILQARRLSAVCQQLLDEMEESDGKDTPPSFERLVREFTRFKEYALDRGLLKDGESGRAV